MWKLGRGREACAFYAFPGCAGGSLILSLVCTCFYFGSFIALVPFSPTGDKGRQSYIVIGALLWLGTNEDLLYSCSNLFARVLFVFDL